MVFKDRLIIEDRGQITAYSPDCSRKSKVKVEFGAKCLYLL